VGTNNKQLNTYAQATSQSSVVMDLNSPLSYLDWYNSHTGISPGQEYIQYNFYLISWYTNKKEQNVNLDLQIRLNYLALLRQLQTFFSTEEIESWYSQVNLDNEKELLISIPYFARKLKEIALYYLRVREEVKKSKIKYNLIGTNTGVVQQLQEQLLTQFTKKPNAGITLPGSTWMNVPELSATKDNLTITIEEFYDDQQYHDQTASLPTSAYYDLENQNLASYFLSKNMPLTAAEWIYRQGTLNLNEDNLIDVIGFAELLLTKYISEDKYTSTNVTAASLSTITDYYDVSIGEGNNIFYWPSGNYKPEISTITRYLPISLSSANIEYLGTAGKTVLDSDTIFIKTIRGIEGAWLRYKQYDEVSTNINAYIEGNKNTAFKFPFPGFGLSSEDVPWTGPSLNTTSEYPYLENNIKEAVAQAYWDSDVSLSGTDAVKINETTLVNLGAYANEQYQLADKIRLRPTAPNYITTSYLGDVQEAWLYKMTKTDIPVAIGNSVIVWPYQRVNPEQVFPSYFPSDIYTACQPVSLSSISLPGSTSSDSISSADIIYKLANYQNTPDQALECAWLSGKSFMYGKYTGITQPGLNNIFYSNNLTKFIWDGPDNVDADTVFKTISHQPDCTFVTTATSYTQHELCTCKQVMFTPFGHPGTDYTNNGGLADYIVEDTTTPNAFNLNTWKDSNNTNYTSSSAFGWYKTTDSIGWGNGRWHTNTSSTSNKFYLRRGKPYLYYRAAIPSSANSLPELIVRHSYNNTDTKWVRGIKDINNNWFSADTTSDMIIRPGDVLLYQKKDTTTYTVVSTSTTINPQATATNINSIWSNYDFITIGNSEYGIPQQVLVGFPTSFYPQGVKSDPALSAQYIQYPPITLGNIVKADWSIVDPYSAKFFINNRTFFTFNPTVTGLYIITLTAITAATVIPGSTYTNNTSGYFIFTNIPAITAANYTPIITNTAISGYSSPVPGFVINIPLYGWNYNTNKPATNTIGVKPFWAAASTLYRDIDTWGAPLRVVDEHNIISQPVISDLTFNTSNYFEYERNYPSSFTWTQPITYRVEVNENIWSTLELTLTAASNFNQIINKSTNQLIALPTNTPSPIQLQNVVDNQPVEVWYKALNAFNWGISAIPELAAFEYTTPNINLTLLANRPWGSLSNRYFPTFAVFPALDSLYTEANRGGYFTPNNLGASVYTNKDFTPVLSLTSTALSGLIEDSRLRAGGRGLTKTDQPTPYTVVIDNNTWLKEPIDSGPIAGTIKKNIIKKYQKFVPYQSSYETNPRLQIGLITPTSRQDPWGGITDTSWTDRLNKPETFTGILNVSAWSQTQLLKQTNKLLDNWVTDIFGNQYGLYKNMSGATVYDRESLPGELWVRKTTQFVSPAKDALSAVFDTYKNTALYRELTSTGIRKIDMFFNTLYLETSGVIILENINYNYDTDTIFSITDNARALSLAIPVSASLSREFSGTSLSNFTFAKAGETWFFPEEKNVIISVCGLSGKQLTPALYKLDLNTQDFIKIFPTNSDDTITIKSLSANNYTTIEAPILTYDSVKKEFVLSVLCRNSSNLDNIIEFTVKNLPDTYLKEVVVYTSQNSALTSNPPIINHTLNITASANTTFTYRATALNSPTSYSLTTPALGWITVDGAGLFTGTPPITGNYYAPFSVSNSVGPTYYSLNINVSS